MCQCKFIWKEPRNAAPDICFLQISAIFARFLILEVFVQGSKCTKNFLQSSVVTSQSIL